MTSNWNIDITKILLPDEIKAVWDDLNRRAPRSVSTRQNRVIFLLATCYGLRCSEIRQLRLMDVKCDISQPFINLRKSITKRKKSRRVPLSIDGTACEQIKQWKAERVSMSAAGQDAFVCTLRKAGTVHCTSPGGIVGDDGPGSTTRTNAGPGRFLSRSGVGQKYKAACKVLGPDRVSTIHIHCGRHTAATVLLHRGMPPVQVMKILGHSNLATTTVYAHIIPDGTERTDYFSGL